MEVFFGHSQRFVVIFIYLLLAFLFCATTLDSCAYTLSSFGGKTDKSGKEPPLTLRLIWTLVLFLVSLGIVLMRSFRAIQLTSMVVALPLIPLTLWMFYKFVKRAREDFLESLEK